MLATTLLQLTSSDLLFREMAFAVVCMAAGGSNVTVFSQNHLSNNAAFGFIKGNKNEYDGSSEFFRVLGSGARRDGESSGSAPKETTYWFEGVLIVLTTQLFRADAVEQGIKGVARYCQTQYPDMVVDAILLSIEHVVLIHIVPASTGHGAEIQHSSILPLFEIQEHLTMKTADRFSASYLSQLANPADEKFQRRQRIQKRKAMQERMLKNEGISMHFGDEEEDDASDDADQEDDLLHPTQVDGSTSATFYALQHVFSSAAGRRLRPSQQGCFPTEIYEHILSFVTDNATRDACLHTSHILHEICLKEYLFCEADGSLLQPCEASKGCVEPDDLPKWFNLANVKTGRQMEASFNRGGCSFLDWDTKQDWTVMVGSGYGKKSLLSEATFKFAEYTD